MSKQGARYITNQDELCVLKRQSVISSRNCEDKSLKMNKRAVKRRIVFSEASIYRSSFCDLRHILCLHAGELSWKKMYFYALKAEI